MIGIGIDTGGTCTDAVIFDFAARRILSSAKSQTTHEKLEKGIRASLDKLPADLLRRADVLALSTTLATNACVENKGGRVLMIFIGASEKVIRREYRSYGFEDTDFMMFVPADAKHDIEPDWENFREKVKTRLRACDSVAISQMNAADNGGAYEKRAAHIICSIRDLPVVCAAELFSDRNVIRRGASALLNARLLPVISEFLEAIHVCMREKQMDIPIVIMRSDGSLMREDYAKEHPVETLLCGPAASTVGGQYLGRQQKALIVDMGGTTTDIAIVKEGRPLFSDRGVVVGDWATFVKGLQIDTFGLGGDTEVTYAGEQLQLGTQRVIPISALCAAYPQVLQELDRLDTYLFGHTVPLYTFYQLMKNIDSDPAYSERDRQICRALSNGPLSMQQLSDALGLPDIYTLNTASLEKGGILLRSGLTPTDAMCVKGDLSLYAPDAAQKVMDFVSRSTNIPVQEMPERIYEMVVHRLFTQITRIQLEDAFADEASFSFSPEVTALVEREYRTASGRQGSDAQPLMRPVFQTDAILVGVGAPTHVFLPRAAFLLGTECILPQEAGVTNALGALIGEVRAVCTAEIRLKYEMTSEEEQQAGYYVYGIGAPVVFETYEEAYAYADRRAREIASERVLSRGAAQVDDCTVRERKNVSSAYGTPLFLNTYVTAEAAGGFGLTLT